MNYLRQPKGYAARVLLDHLSEGGSRITTMVGRFPRFILAEFNTHRMFSRNSASSRAIPVEARARAIMKEPVWPIEWGVNKSGMTADDFLDIYTQRKAEAIWRDIMEMSVDASLQLAALKPPVHKQVANRPAETYAYHEVIFTATDNGRGPLPWDNFFSQRNHQAAQPEFRYFAAMALEAYLESTPRVVPEGFWHLPFIQPDEEEWDLTMKTRVSVARCARVSYLTHEGVRDPKKDVELFFKLASADPPHMSPFEHVAMAVGSSLHASGNFRGWQQYRQVVFGQTQNRHDKLERQRAKLGIGAGRTPNRG